MKERQIVLTKCLSMIVIICITCFFYMSSVDAKTTKKSTGIIALSETRHVVKKGRKFKLNVSISKARFRKKKILWSSNRKKVATVSKNGVVKAKRNGTVIITAKIKGTKYSAKCKVIVGIPVKTIGFAESRMQIRVGDEQDMKLNIHPRNASLKKVSYKSYDESIVTVTKDGKIHGWKPGTTQIKAVSQDGSKVVAKTTITVYHENPGTENINLPEENVEGDSKQVDIESEDAQNDPNQENPGDETGQEDITGLRNVEIFMNLIEDYSSFIKEYGEYFYKSKTATVDSYQKAYYNVTRGVSTGINCASPINWALKEMGLNPFGQIYGTASGFVIKGANTNILLHEVADFLDDFPAIDMDVQTASVRGFLKSGDILSMVINGTRSHTLVYIGLSEEGHALVYEAGNIPYGLGYNLYGCGPLDYYNKSNYIITEVMRFK